VLKGEFPMHSRVPNIIAALRALGEILDSQGETVAVVVLGGAALIMQGFVARVTQDVDVIAISRETQELKNRDIEPPEPLPEPLVRGILRVARDFNLPDDWMNTTIGLQWKTGLPPGFSGRIHWEQYGGLWLGLADRYDLIFLKLFAAADSEGPSSVHYQDLMALHPTHDELGAAAQWVRSQDPSPLFAKIIDQVLEHAKSDE
jgi:alkylation response protein AidB-like acyl-CoA dehydrogenase